MKFKLVVFLIFAVFQFGSLNLIGQSYKTIFNGKYENSSVNKSKNNLTESNIVKSYNPNPLKPYTAEDVTVKIPKSDGKYTLLSYSQGPFMSTGGRYVYFNVGDIQPDSLITITIGGLEPDKEYDFVISLFLEAGEGIWQTISFETAQSPNINPNMLIIIDEDLNDDPEILTSINQYASDIKSIYSNFSYSIYSLSNTNSDRKLLYDDIKKLYFSENLNYLFFLGRNGSIKYTQTNYNNNEVTFQTEYSSLSYYADIFNQPIAYDSPTNRFFLNYGGNSSCRVVQSGSKEIKFGIVSPSLSDFDHKKKYIIDYFNKLHLYRENKIVFDKAALVSLTMYPEDDLITTEDLLSTNRFKKVDNVKSSHKYNVDFHESDDTWKQDYLRLLNSNSYEFCLLNVHGAPTNHYFGISSSDIIDLNQLNTLFFFFESCNVGDISVDECLASEYLTKGNTLSIVAFTTPMLFFNTFSQIVLSDDSQGNSLYKISKGKIFSDAFQNTDIIGSSFILFGDPLMSMNYNNLSLSINIESGESDTLIAKPSAEGEYTYQWFFNDSPIQNANSIKLIPHEKGNYKVVAVGNNCFAESSTYILNTLTSTEDFNLSSIHIYPNPSSNFIKIIGIPIGKENTIKIYNLYGEQVDQVVTDKSQQNIDIRQLNSGIYVIKINELAEKFIKF